MLRVPRHRNLSGINICTGFDSDLHCRLADQGTLKDDRFEVCSLKFGKLRLSAFLQCERFRTENSGGGQFCCTGC